MAYLIALLGATCVLILIAFVCTFDRRLKDLPGPWIMNEGHSND
ncbi:hypothetical protein [Bradyrhizobium zhanjiangense]|nr:hypothetical protein [Bradyrhizobium zhanjiangense]